MKKTIYNVAVLMESQQQCDRMKQLCIDNGLPYWKYESAFEYSKGIVFGFGYDEYVEDSEFFTYPLDNDTIGIKTIVTESEFIELLKQEKA